MYGINTFCTYRAAHSLHGLLAGEVFRQAKINHLDTGGVAFASKHEVLRLDVAMTDVLSMEVDECREQLVHDHCCLFLAQMLSLKNEMEEFTSFAVPVILDQRIRFL